VRYSSASRGVSQVLQRRAMGEFSSPQAWHSHRWGSVMEMGSGAGTREEWASKKSVRRAYGAPGSTATPMEGEDGRSVGWDAVR